MAPASPTRAHKQSTGWRLVRARRCASVRVRALTLIEVVLAVLLLTLTATAVMTAVGFVVGTEGRARKILAATEVANRLVLQHLTDEKQMPDRSRPLDYGEYRFVYDTQMANVTMQMSSASLGLGSATAAANLSRFRLFTVYVYEAETTRSGAAVRGGDGEPLAVLSRIYDPVAVRNPDVMETIGRDPDRIKDIIGIATGGGALPDSLAGATGSNSGRQGSGLGRSRDRQRSKSGGNSGKEKSR